MLNEKIKVVFVVDNNYFKYMLVTLQSIIFNTNKHIIVYIINCGITSDNLKYLSHKKIFNRTEFRVINIDTKVIENYDVKTHVSIAAYSKVFLSDLILDEKVIYLDSDLILNADIGCLWDEFEENIKLKAVWNPYYNYDNEYFGLDPDEKTFNSGVMLLNLQLMRDNYDSLKLVKFLNEYHNKTKLHDQAAFNAVYKGDWVEIDYKWNLQVFMIQSRYTNLYLTKSEYRDLIKNPYVIHFNTGSKPWQYKNNHPNKKIYLRQYEKIMGRLKYNDINLKSLNHKVKEILKFCYFKINNLF